ncbi:MAG TPA: hypothetical protein VMM13_06610, partial [Euzebya sp.]|nr:hypothetical protein [Euzebya sp.]
MLADVRPQLQRLREHLEPIGIAPAEALALLILLAGAATLAGIVWWTSRPPTLPPPPLTVTSDAPLPGASAPLPSGQEVGSTPEGEVVVHVAGHVVHPG